MRHRKNQGFTLVEILIVVVILGILAAIVIPQFSDASTQSKVSSAKSSLQTLRSQISLYKIQHNDLPPTNTAGAGTNFADQMTIKSDVDRTSNASGLYGAYLQSVPKNPFNNSDTVAGTDAAGVGWVYNTTTGQINLGGLGATDLNGNGVTTDTGETHFSW